MLKFELEYLVQKTTARLSFKIYLETLHTFLGLNYIRVDGFDQATSKFNLTIPSFTSGTTGDIC